MTKDKMYGFRFLKGVLGIFFKFYYNPTIIGKENIPEDGAVLIVGNHIHLMDQCLPIMATKRPVHYMAKKEYFDDKKVAWFFKMAGCIPVDRSKKDQKASDTAIEVLNEKNVLGLFPEGTRNALKEEKIIELYKNCPEKYGDYKKFKKQAKKQRTSQINYLEELVKDKKITEEEYADNILCADTYLLKLVKKKIITKKEYDNTILLPFKFGAVSMAKKTDAYLVPFGISGKYKFKSKELIVRIGKPFKVSGDLEVANNKLRKAVCDLIKDNPRNNGK